ncbi:hypothetical protein C5167_022927 [Papaver somniferum]|uniref:Uncharacterized protein n=1 Tax=Papaver somniferum TaxID=3469 RepID=A0A4Y7JMI0_PAPSO|nr:hypothetical protein C5167_022927 [Papaver somniferum]
MDMLFLFYKLIFTISSQHVGSRKRSCIDALVESNQPCSSSPCKSPRQIGHAQRRELIQPENEKAAKEKQNFYLGLRRSPSLIQQAKHQELESSEEEKEHSVGRSS